MSSNSVSEYVCVSCGRSSSIPFAGRRIRTKTLKITRVVVQEMECEYCQSLIAQNSNWLAGRDR